MASIPNANAPTTTPPGQLTTAGEAERPAVTFIIPMFNAGATVGVTLGSLRMLKDLTWNAIVVDDGSTDGDAGAELVRHVASYDPRVTLLQKVNGGLSSARNAGIQHLVVNPNLRGEFVTFLDSDDSIIAYAYPKLVALARETGTSAAGHFALVDQSSHTLRDIAIGPDCVGLAELLDLHFVVTHCLLHRWVDMAPHRFDETLARVEDYDMWFRMAQAGTRWTVLRSNVVRYRVGPSAADKPDPYQASLQGGAVAGKQVGAQAGAPTGAMSRSFAAMLTDGRKVVRRAYASVRADAVLASTIDCSPERELRTLGKHTLTWATRTAICGAEPGDFQAEPGAIAAGLAMATEFASRHPEHWPRTVDGLAAAVRSSIELGQGRPFSGSEADLSEADRRFVDDTAARTVLWCRALIGAGLLDAEALDRLGFQLASAAMHPADVGAILVDRAREKHDPKGPVIVFGFGNNGRSVVASLRKNWGGQIRIRDTRLSPDRPADLGLVPVDCKLERWDDPVPDYAAVVLSIADAAGPMSRAPLRDLPKDRIIRFDPESDLEGSIWVAATDRAVRQTADGQAATAAPAPVVQAQEGPNPALPPRICMILPLEKGLDEELMHLAKELLKANRSAAPGGKNIEGPAGGKRPSFDVYLMPAGCPHDEIHAIEAELRNISGPERVHHAHSHSHPAHLVTLCAEHIASATVILCPPHELSLMACQQVRTGTAYSPLLIAVATKRESSERIWGAWPSAEAVIGFSHDAISLATAKLTGVRHRQTLRKARATDGQPLVQRRLTPGQLKVVVHRPEALGATAESRLLELCRALATADANARIAIPADGDASRRLAELLATAGVPRSVARVVPAGSFPATLGASRAVDVILYSSKLEGEFAELATSQGSIALSVDEMTPIEVVRALGDRKQLSELQRQAEIQRTSSVGGASASAPPAPPADGVLELCARLMTEIPPGTPHASPVSPEQAVRLFQVETDPAKPPYPDLISPSHSAWFMRDQTALDYAGRVLETALAHHPARAARRLMLFPPALRSPGRAELDRWQSQGLLPLALHGLLNPLVQQRLARAMVELEMPLVRAGRSPESLRIAVAIADSIWADLGKPAIADPSIVAIIELPGQQTAELVRLAAAGADDSTWQGGKPVVTFKEAGSLILDGILVASPAGEPELVRGLAAATEGRVTVGGIFTDSWLH